MRFITLALEGYGRFRERTVFEFDAGLTCVVGANESGKSTVLAALLDALYTLPTSTAQSVRERIHWGHPHGWTLELDLTLRGERVRIRKFHPVDEPRRRAEFVLEHNGETLSGEAARERWEQLWRVPLAVYRATACVAQRAVARIEKGDLKSLQQQLRESAVNADLNRILTALQNERRRLRQDIERAQNRLRDTEQRLHAARQAEQQRHTLRERLRQAQQEADALREQLERDERLLERWREWHEQRTTLERLRREADANQRHIEQLEQIERRLQEVEADLQRDFAAWQALPDDHKAQVDAAWVRYQDAVRRLGTLEREAQAQRGAQQASVGRARARVGYAIVGLALCAASVPLWGVAPALGAIALGLGLVALAVAGLWRTRPTEPDTLTPALDATRREAHSHWEQLTALLAQAGFTVEAASANGARPTRTRPCNASSTRCTATANAGTPCSNDSPNRNGCATSATPSTTSHPTRKRCATACANSPCRCWDWRNRFGATRSRKATCLSANCCCWTSGCSRNGSDWTPCARSNCAARAPCRICRRTSQRMRWDWNTRAPCNDWNNCCIAPACWRPPKTF
jgi:predicted  nucleic acid-binding Zn-ribbon protein